MKQEEINIDEEILYIGILKIHAEGTYKSFMTVYLPNCYIKSIRIPRELYLELKKCGAKTSQSFRKKGQKQ